MGSKPNKELMKEIKKIEGWMKNKETPQSLEIKLGLKKLGDKAPEAKNYAIWGEFSKWYILAKARAKDAVKASYCLDTFG
ncbi:unnamed protein product [Phytophthora lilii]|uniref:Unnamed protein product n=1 Tax=Phytophthora lilii TaxID=2077276 RepID=A0A9W6YK69_9STRA|nr:unnamed protein product [Phytophthora lilii]